MKRSTAREPSMERLARLTALVAVASGVYYVTWRGLYTLNWDVMWLSLPLWLAELWALAFSAAYFVTVCAKHPRREPPAPPDGVTVDVFVPTYNEPVWVVRRTLLGALAMRHPHETWLLDDGDRPEMRRLAKALGCQYLARGNNVGAKAGNLTAALRRTHGDLIAVFDADHVPAPSFLERTLGFFQDPSVAFVQTPQEFYNVDSFQHAFDRRRERLWHEQSLFFRLIQPGKDRWNAAFFCGSCAVVRREALEDVGGFPTETVTEDLHLSIMLHARGWRSVYQPQVLAYGLAPKDPAAFHSQRVRWGQGAMQVLRLVNPLTCRGLTPIQRVLYASSILHWLDAWKAVVFLLSPLVFLTTGLLPLSTSAAEFLPRFGVYYVLLLAAYKLSGRGLSPVLLNEGFSMMRLPTSLKATTALLIRRKLGFVVTDKQGGAARPQGLLAFYSTVALACAGALAVGVLRWANGAEESVIAFGINAAWAGMWLGLGLWAAISLFAAADRRGITRCRAMLAVAWGPDGPGRLGLLEDIHEYGARLCVRLEDEPVGDITVELWPLGLRCRGTVLWSRAEGQRLHVGVGWDDRVGSSQMRSLAAYTVLAASAAAFNAMDTRYRRRVGSRSRSDSNGQKPLRIQHEDERFLAIVGRQSGDREPMLGLVPLALPLGATVHCYDEFDDRAFSAAVTSCHVLPGVRSELYEVVLREVEAGAEAPAPPEGVSQLATHERRASERQEQRRFHAIG